MQSKAAQECLCISVGSGAVRSGEIPLESFPLVPWIRGPSTMLGGPWKAAIPAADLQEWTLPADWKAWPHPGWVWNKTFPVESGLLPEELSLDKKPLGSLKVTLRAHRPR